MLLQPEAAHPPRRSDSSIGSALSILRVMVQDAPTTKRVRSVARAVLVAAACSALLGIALEITAHLLLSGRRAAWLIKPYLYAALPKPFVHTDWLSVASSVAVAILMLGW